MSCRFPQLASAFLVPALLASVLSLQAPARTAGSAEAQKSTGTPPPNSSAGSLSAGVYRNKDLGFSCKIPPGWVLRTEEMNARDNDESAAGQSKKDSKPEGGRVLLAAFSRPPQARAEDVNSSILIATENVSAYPGLKDAAQYFGPLAEVVKAQGFAAVEEPYEFAVGTKPLARGDFQKDVGTRVMRQSTLVMLAHGYAVSFTFIGGTEDEVEELIGGLSFVPQKRTK
jgi:hypothetical protein